jgi:hypothetical protein
MTVLSGLKDLNAKRRALRSLRVAQDAVAEITDNPYDPYSDFTRIKLMADELSRRHVAVTVACAVCQKPLEVICRVGEDGTPTSALCTECNTAVEEVQ